jgi:hypothetical protein
MLGQKVQVLRQEDPLVLHHLFIQGCSKVLTHLRESKTMEGVNVIRCLFHRDLLLVLLLLFPTHGLMDRLKILSLTCPSGRKESYLAGEHLGMFIWDLIGNYIVIISSHSSYSFGVTSSG